VQCFRRAALQLGMRLRVVAADMNPDLSAACAHADAVYTVPRCDDDGFVDRVLEIATAEKVSLVIPTIDPELMPLSHAANRFARHGIRIHVGTPEAIEIARDKQRTARHLADAGLPVPSTVPLEVLRLDSGRLDWPVFVKPAGGSAGRGLHRVVSPDELPDGSGEPMVAQELLSGPEYTINMFVDQAGALRCAVPHERLGVRAGEVEKGLTVRSEPFRMFAEGIVKALPGLRGASCFQLIRDVRSGPKIIEINARFGGGYPLADHAGASFARWLLEEVSGRQPSCRDDWREGILMLRYDAAIFRDAGRCQCPAAS
jgi:carbamoyl-phosphate synthase large subunit